MCIPINTAWGLDGVINGGVSCDQTLSLPQPERQNSLITWMGEHEFILNEKSQVTLKIMDVMGSMVFEKNSLLEKGRQKIDWSEINSGIYIYELEINGTKMPIRHFNKQFH